MSYHTLMVNLQVGHANAPLVRFAADLAEHCGNAHLIGIAACQPNATIYGEGMGVALALDACTAEMDRELLAAERLFHTVAAAPHNDIEWRGETIWCPVADYVARHARVADLLIVNPARPGYMFDASRQADPGALLMQSGRPVLIVPLERATAPCGPALICWKDTRESRRAITDALPLLRLAESVAIVELAEEGAEKITGARLAELVAWLARHGIEATAFAPLASGDNAAQLLEIADEREIDLVVAGAYGHSRLREWMFGGVTRALLRDARRCVVLSH